MAIVSLGPFNFKTSKKNPKSVKALKAVPGPVPTPYMSGRTKTDEERLAATQARRAGVISRKDAVLQSIAKQQMQNRPAELGEGVVSLEQFQRENPNTWIDQDVTPTNPDGTAPDPQAAAKGSGPKRIINRKGDVLGVIEGDTVRLTKPKNTPAVDSPVGPEETSIAKQLLAAAKKYRADRKEQLGLIATGLVESNLQNLAGGDRDSQGVLQQRPSQGWGTPEQVRSIPHATGKFLQTWRRMEKDGTIKPSMTVGQKSQAVQRSAFPEKYDQRLPEARQIIAALHSSSGSLPNVGALLGSGENPTPDGASPSGALPVSSTGAVGGGTAGTASIMSGSVSDNDSNETEGSDETNIFDFIYNMNLARGESDDSTSQQNNLMLAAALERLRRRK